MTKGSIAAAVGTLLVTGAIFFWTTHQATDEDASKHAIVASTAGGASALASPTDRTGSDESRELLPAAAREDDLANKVALLYARSEAGDAEASRQIAAVYEECWLFALNPTGFREDMRIRSQVRPDLTEKMAAAGGITERRCAGFAGERIGPSAIKMMRDRAIAQGSVAAKVEEFARNAMLKGAPPEQIKAAANEVLAMRDPEAVAAMAQLMGAPTAGELQALQPLPAGTSLSEAAWNVAACRMGRDCGPNSAAVRQMCLSGGVNCELRDIQSFYEQAVLPPADVPKLRQLVTQLTQGANG